MTSERTTFEVHLAVYDLSRGMARSLSSQFLGPDHALDIIPHTGLVVYGKEYFFGGGIQSQDPFVFRQSMGIFPISQELLGRTSVTRQEFEQWCVQCMRNGRFTIESYDLLHQNCNNFCHEAALEGLRLPQGIPEWIINVPRRFLASPMGQMIFPILEQMQITGTAASNAAPFRTAAPPVLASAPPPTASNGHVNPWANLPSSSSNYSTTTTAASSESSSTTTRQVVQAKLTTPVLDSFTKPLLSSDAKTATLCAKKLIASTDNDDDKAILQEISDTLVKGTKPSSILVEESSRVILTQLSTGENVAFALMLLRLVMLHPPKNSIETNSFFSKCMDWIQQQLLLDNNDNSNALSSPAARSMAWCTLSNAHGTMSSSSSSSSSIASWSLDTLVECALSDLSSSSSDCSSSPQVRQAAAAFLYNVSLVEMKRTPETGELSDLLVSLLCACLDGVSLETDDSCQLRRLVVAAKIVNPNSTDNVNAAAKSLVQDLGFADALVELVARGESNATSDAEKVHKVATEFLRILES